MSEEIDNTINRNHELATVISKSRDNHIVSNVICNQRFEKEYLYYSKEESLIKFKEDFLDEYTLEADNELDRD